jgi:hypothetical protein
MAKSLKTQDDVFKLTTGSKAEAVFFDEGKPKDRVVGLALRVREGGSRKWVYFYRWNTAQQKLTIGDASAITLSEARTAARGYYKMIGEGKNPAEVLRAAKIQEQSKQATTFATVMDARDHRPPAQRHRREQRPRGPQPRPFVTLGHVCMGHHGGLRRRQPCGGNPQG